MGRHAPSRRADKTVTGLLAQAPMRSRTPARRRARRGQPDRPTNPTAGQHRQSGGESDQPGDPAPFSLSGWRERPAVRHTGVARCSHRATARDRHGSEVVGEDVPRSPRRSAMSSATTRGVVFVHSAPPALCPHVEWAVGAVLGVRLHLDWTGQPAEPGSLRTELSWQGPAGTGARLASALRGWDRLRYEVTEEPSAGADGARWSHTPDLGVH